MGNKCFKSKKHIVTPENTNLQEFNNNTVGNNIKN